PSRGLTSRGTGRVQARPRRHAGKEHARRMEKCMGAIAWPTMLVGGALVMSLSATPARAQAFAEIDAAVRDGIRRGIYPGAVVVIGRRDSLMYARGYGHFTWNSSSPVPDPDSTLWDVASITKVVRSEERRVG